MIFTWITNGTGGSVLLATVHHAAFVFAGLTNAAIVRPIPYFTVFGLTLGFVACAVVWRCSNGTNRGRIPVDSDAPGELGSRMCERERDGANDD